MTERVTLGGPSTAPGISWADRVRRAGSVAAGWWRAWWENQPLRSRLVVSASLAVAIAVTGVAGVAYVVVHHELIGQIDGELAQQANQLRAQAELYSGSGLPVIHLQTHFGQPGGAVQLVTENGATDQPANQQLTLPVTPTDLAVAAGRHPPTLTNALAQGVAVRILTTPLLPGLAVEVALPSGALDGQLHRLALALVALSLGALLVAAVLTWSASRAVLAPVARLTEAAEQIAKTRDLSHRITESHRDELGRLAVSFNAMLDALAGSMRAQRQLVADASHELRTPLASIRTNVEVLHRSEELTADERADVLRAIVSQVEELTGLVTDVVELARGDEPVTATEDVDLAALVAHAVDRAQGHWPAVRFAVTTRPCTVVGMAARLDRAVANLLDNAGKFSPAGSVVEVNLAGDGHLSVSDRGPGIPVDALPHVFDRFFRAAEARGLPGSGLGLAIVAQAAAAHHGRVRVTNRPGGGLTAELWLPAIPDSATGAGGVTGADGATIGREGAPDGPAQR